MPTLEADAARAGLSSRGQWILSLLLTLAVTLPFIGKALHVDDVFFLRVTENVVADPLDPYAGSIDWWDRPYPIVYLDSNPPALNYYLAPFAALSHSSEIVLHAAMLPFHLLWAASLLSLGRRFTRYPLAIVVFGVANVAVLVSGNVMRDVPSAALGVAAVALLVAGSDRDDARRLLFASLLAALAMLTKYSGLVGGGVAFAYPLIKRRWRQLLYASIPLAAFALWAVYTDHAYGEAHVLTQLGRGYTRPGHAWQDNLSGLPVVAGSVLFLAPLLIWRGVATRDRFVVAGTALVCVSGAIAIEAYLGAAADLQYRLFALSGMALLAPAGLHGLRAVLSAEGHDERGDDLFLCSWLAATLLFAVVSVPFQAVRHVLPFVAPLLLLVARYLAPRLAGSRGERAVVIGLAALQLAIGIAVARADADYAEVYRDFAGRARTAIAALAGGGGEADATVHFLGHWGWMHYAEGAGLHKLHAGSPTPREGEWLIVPAFVDKGEVLAQHPGLEARLRQRDEISYPGRLPLRTFNPFGASFYALVSRRASGGVANVPYRFGEQPPLEIFRLYRVGPAVRGASRSAPGR